MVFPRPVRGLGILAALKRLRSNLLRPERVPIKDLLLGVFVHLVERLIAPKTATIYFSDPKQKIGVGFSLCSNGFLNGLLPIVLSTAILLGLDINRRPQAVAEQADWDWLRDYHVSIKFLEYGL